MAVGFRGWEKLPFEVASGESRWDKGLLGDPGADLGSPADNARLICTKNKPIDSCTMNCDYELCLFGNLPKVSYFILQKVGSHFLDL